MTGQQKQALISILTKYYGGQQSIAAEAPTIQELVKVLQATVTNAETSAPSPVTESETDGTKAE